MTGNARPAQIAAFAVAMTMKGSTADGGREVRRRHGGDGVGEPITGIVVRVCRWWSRHGGRAALLASGGADTLEALGVRIDLGTRPGRAASRVGSGSASAPGFSSHSTGTTAAVRESFIAHVQSSRGLVNPARQARLVGCATSPVMAGCLLRADPVFYGDDGLASYITTTTRSVWRVAASA